VNLDGKPLPDGSIMLLGDGEAPANLPIKDGKFAGEAKPGKKRVEIRAYKMGQPTKMGDQVIEASKENFLPSEYNSASKITGEVTAEGISPSTFEVKSK
jgi:hypothetical protein